MSCSYSTCRSNNVVISSTKILVVAAATVILLTVGAAGVVGVVGVAGVVVAVSSDEELQAASETASNPKPPIFFARSACFVSHEATNLEIAFSKLFCLFLPRLPRAQMR